MYTVPGNCTPLDGRPQKEVQVRPNKLEVVASFCYLGDMLSAAGGCELSTTTWGVVGWCEGVMYLVSPGRPTDIGLQLGKACYRWSR